MRMDGYNDCIIGVVERYGQPDIVCYDKAKVINKLMSDGMTFGDAIDFHEYNQAGAWVGDLTPCFLTHDNDPDLDEYNS